MRGWRICGRWGGRGGRAMVRGRKASEREGVRVVEDADPYRAKSESRYEDER